MGAEYYVKKISTNKNVVGTFGNVVATLVARQTSEAEVPGSNPATPTMILGALQDYYVIL